MNTFPFECVFEKAVDYPRDISGTPNCIATSLIIRHAVLTNLETGRVYPIGFPLALSVEVFQIGIGQFAEIVEGGND
jgi:hypothetical protein